MTRFWNAKQQFNSTEIIAIRSNVYGMVIPITVSFFFELIDGVAACAFFCAGVWKEKLID
ncbi:MAG: hypothetical protein ACYDG2_00380 [Ruminiclostridium sp.]